MTLAAQATTFAASLHHAAAPDAARRSVLPPEAMIADPAPGWAAANPNRALAFLFVSPRDCAALDELMAL